MSTLSSKAQAQAADHLIHTQPALSTSGPLMMRGEIQRRSNHTAVIKERSHIKLCLLYSGVASEIPTKRISGVPPREKV